MTWRDLALRIRALFFRSRSESELDEELRFHLEMEARKYRLSGADAAKAERNAAFAFGGMEQVKEECRDQRRTRWLEDFFQDLRFSARLIRKDRGYAAAVIAALALGIGLNTALFTLFSAAVLKPLPVPEPSRLVSVWRTSARLFSFSDYLYYRDHNSVFASMAAETPEHLRLASAPGGVAGSNGIAEPLMGLFVTANYFSTFGVNPAAGRSFSPQDEQLTAGPYPALLSENYWERRFGRDSSILGQNLLISGVHTVVIGITPRDFMGTRADVPDIWMISSALGDAQRRALDRTTLSCVVTARLKPGATLQAARAELSVMADRLRRDYPATERQWSVAVAPAARFGTNQEALKRLFGILQVAMGLVLLIACSNVAGLLLAKAATRQREVAVRLSIGATRGRLVRQFLSESVLMSFVAGLLALVVTWRGLGAIGRAVSASLAVQGGTIAVDVTPDLHVFAYLLGMSLLAGISFALVPALQSTQPDLVGALKDETCVLGVRGKGRMRAWMVAGQIAVSLALLIGAGLLTSSSLRLLSLDPGFETRNVLSMTISSPQVIGYSADRMRSLETRLESQLRAVPGVVSVSFATRVPLGGTVTMTQVVPRDDRTAGAQQFPYTYVSQEYFQTLGIRLLRGRAFTASEFASNAQVAVISEAFARRFWPEGDAIGKRIMLGSPTEVHFAGRLAPVSAATEVIGVAQEVYSSMLTARDAGAVYLPKPLNDWNSRALVRVAGDPESISRILVSEVHGLEPSLPVSIETLQHTIMAGEMATGLRVGAMIFAAIGLLGFILAAVGVYSMVAYSITQQTREIGIRMALGARQANVLQMLLGASLKWIGAGLVAGAGLGAVLSRVLASQLLLEGGWFLDPAVIVAVSFITGILALIAASVPAFRATKLDPALALRLE